MAEMCARLFSFVIAIVTAVVTLSACSKAPTSPSVSVQPVPIGEITQTSVPAPPRSDVGVPNAIGLTRYLAFGDSITWGASSGWDPRFTFAAAPGAYPERLLVGLNTYHSPQQFTMFNEGQPGEWVTNALDRFKILLTQHRPQAVLLLEGFNDLNNHVSIANTITGIKRLLDAAAVAGVPVLVATMYQTYEVVDPLGVVRWNAATEIEDFNVEVRKLPMGRLNVYVVDLYPLLNDRDLIGNDGVHTTDEGNIIMATAFLDAIESAFPVRGNIQ